MTRFAQKGKEIYVMRIVATEICILPRMSDLVLQYVCRAMVQRLHTDSIHVYNPVGG